MTETTSIRLTQTVKCAGCASKIPPSLLYEALNGIQWPVSENVLVGFEDCDDAGVYRISEDRVLVATTDFFTPVVDDPYDYGRIAAANALSDIYAMGAKPLFALNILCYPRELGPEILHGVLRGGADCARQAGIVVIGGHSVESPEMKFGMAVIGEARPEVIKPITGAQTGDALILTKPLGTGVLNTAVKKGLLPTTHYPTLVEWMARLNDKACEAMLSVESHGCTDITGFGLAGHSMEMAKASKKNLMIESKNLPLLPWVNEAVIQGCLTRGDRTNREYVGNRITIADRVIPLINHLVFDPQTSGGLLISVAKKDAIRCLQKLHAGGDTMATIIGHVEDHPIGQVTLCN